MRTNVKYALLNHNPEGCDCCSNTNGSESVGPSGESFGTGNPSEYRQMESNTSQDGILVIHPTCGTDLRRCTKVAGMLDAVLSGFSIFCGVAVLNNIFSGVKDPDIDAFPVSCMLAFIILMGFQSYLAFRLYRAAHEREIGRLRAWRKAAGAVMALTTASILLFHHTLPKMFPPVTTSPYPLLWFYVIYSISGLFRIYMVWIVSSFLKEFELT